MGTHSKRRLAATAALAALCSGTLGACGDAGRPAPDRAATQAKESRFDPSHFGSPSSAANRWLPLEPGTQWVRDGATNLGHRRVPHRVITTVTDVSRVVDGVRTVAVMDQDVDAGQISQESLDFLAEDKQGNVWDMGSYTEAYEGGRFVSVQDAWLSGVKGGRGGILVQGAPRAGSQPYSIAKPPGDDPDVAQVVGTGQSRCVPFKCFTGVLVVREGKASAPDNEFKYYAPGVGQILNLPRSASLHKDVEKLVNLTHLSARGLTEMSREALKLDAHARAEKPAIFGRGPAATRTL